MLSTLFFRGNRGSLLENFKFEQYNGEWKNFDLHVEGTKNQIVFDGTVEVPAHWDERTIRTACIQYLRIKNGIKEKSFKTVFDRVVSTITNWGIEDNYFPNQKSAEYFYSKLYEILFNQKAAFNSPVWYNVGIKENPQTSACFILGIEDSLKSISETQSIEMSIYQGGSGAGVNYSPLRGSCEALTSGGVRQVEGLSYLCDNCGMKEFVENDEKPKCRGL